MTKEQFTEFVTRAQAGDKSAFDRIFRIYEGKLKTYISQHINDKSQADDALQNTFIAVFNNIGQLRSVDGFKSWLYRIAHNECMAINNAVKKQQERSFSLYADYGEDDGGSLAEQIEDTTIELPEDFATNAELQKLLAGTLNSLPKKQRECLILYYYQQKPMKEIAETLGVSESTVKTNKGKALDTLRRKLEKYRKSYNFAFAPMGLFLNKLVGTGKVKSAYTGTAIVSHTMGVSVIVAATAGAVAIGAGALMMNKQARQTADHKMGDINADSSFTTSREMRLDDSSLVLRPDDSSHELDSFNDSSVDYEVTFDSSAADGGNISFDSSVTDANGDNGGNGNGSETNSFEMPDDLKNLPWEDIDVSIYNSGNEPYFVNEIAKNAPLIENSIQDLRVMLLKGFKVNEDKGCVQFIYEPICSRAEDYTMYVPVLNFALGVIEGECYLEDGKVIYCFEDLYKDKPETDRASISSIINSTSYSISTHLKQDYSESGQAVEKSRYTLIFESSGTQRLCVDSNGSCGSRLLEGVDLFTTRKTAFDAKNNCVLHDDGSIVLDWRATAIPKLYLGNYDENGAPLDDPYNQRPYDKIKHIEIEEIPEWGKPSDPSSEKYFEVDDDLLYALLVGESLIDESGNEVYNRFDIIHKELIWLPPDTHYTELNLPDHLTGYYSDEALQRLNADHIYLGADSEGFVEQLEQSQDEKVRAILAQIREDNNLY